MQLIVYQLFRKGYELSLIHIYKQRMEKGLSFLEFNYMIMQSFDFYMLYQKYGCNMQFGGDDQWSNCLLYTSRCV